VDFDAGADGIARGGFCGAGEVEREVGGVALEGVFEEAKAGGGAVGDPEVEVTIEVIIDEADGAGIVLKVPTDGGGDIGKTSVVSAVEEGIIGFAAREGFVFMEEAIEGFPALAVGLEGVEVLGIERRLRHDLSPVETSQIAAVFGGDEAIGGEDVWPAVVINIGEGGGPAPAGHGGASGVADVLEAAFAISGEEGVSPSHALEGGAGFGVGGGFELFLVSDAVSSAGEHVADVEVHPSVAVEVPP